MATTGKHFGIAAMALASAITLVSAAFGDAPRALPPGTLPQDARLGPLRTLDDYFPFTPVASPEAWAKRAAQLRRQAQLATGLWPMPTRTPLNAVIHGKVDRDDYSVEKVYFESFPGHFVTGNLYRPKGKPAGAKFPAVLNPHGHWANGRFYDAGEAETRKQIAIGAERFEVGGRYPLQARCVQQARMGCVAFMYDMVGVADSLQFEHRPGVRDKMNTKENWGFFSPQAELHLQNMMGLQTWNSVRALDFIASLPDVDAKRIAVTGASGGGTQTFMLVAVDDRPAVSAPCVMVSTAMQGGCTCENAPYLRVDAGNIDIAGLAAPRPLNMVAANDWTKEILTKGYPDLQRLYSMLGHPDRVRAEAFVNFEHNYNSVSRTVVYNFLNKHLGLGLSEPVLERDYKPLTTAEMSVWDAQHPAPPHEEKDRDEHERKLVKWMTDDAAKQIDALLPKANDAGSLEEYRRVVGGAFDTMIGRRLEDVGAVEYDLKDKVDKGSYLQMTSLLTLSEKKEQVPALFLHPRDGWNKQVVVWLDESGKAGLLRDDGSPQPAVEKLLAAGYSVAGADLMEQGEFLRDAGKPAEARVAGYGDRKEPWQKAAIYTFGYNRALFAQRVHDALTLIKFVQTNEHAPEQIHLVGLGPVAGPIAAAVRAQAGPAIAKAAIDTGGFRFAGLDRVSHPMFLPGAAKYHDLPGLLALSAPHPLWLAGEGDRVPEPLQAAYAAVAQPATLTVAKGQADAATVAAWIVR